MPTFFACTLKFPTPIVKQIESYMKSVPWDGGDINKKGDCLVAWTNACRSKDQGGLGIIDIKAHNKALLLKFLHKFYTKANLHWVDLIWKCFYKRGAPPHAHSPTGSFGGEISCPSLMTI